MSLDAEVTRFLAAETALLDAGRYAEWVALFDADGYYWWPATTGQSSPESGLSLWYEDRRLLEMRARRLAHPASHVQQPPVRTHHHLSGVVVRSVDVNELDVRAMALIVTLRDSEQRLWSAALHYLLRREDGALRIRTKRVELLNCDTPLPALTVPF